MFLLVLNIESPCHTLSPCTKTRNLENAYFQKAFNWYRVIHRPALLDFQDLNIVDKANLVNMFPLMTPILSEMS